VPIRTIDAHAAGEPLRLVVEGFPSPRGATMADKRAWAARHADHIRRALMLEPRGHADMTGAVLTEAVSPGSHAGLLFMHHGGFGTISGHGVIAATTIALERGLLMPGGDAATIVFDTVAGSVRAHAQIAGAGGKVERVSFTHVPSYVLQGGTVVKLAARSVRADIAFAGEAFAIVDAEAVGLPIDGAHLPELRRAGAAIVEALGPVQEVDAVIFTGPPGDERADLRNATVFADGAVDRSPCGAGTAAVMAVIDAMGLLSDERPFVIESIIGTRLTGRLAGRTVVGEHAAIVAEIAGEAWITGEHVFLVDEGDPLAEGFRL